MSRDVAHRRIAALHGHLTLRVEGDMQDPILSTQDCAATGTLRYARACAEDLCFARVSAPSAREVNVERTALQFAEHTLLALQKANMDSFASIPDPPAYARPALGDSTKDGTPATAPPPKQQRPLVRKPAARLSPVVARALIRASAQQQQVQQQQRAGEATFASPRLTAGWTPKVDAMETANHYQLEIALPGVRKEDLRVELWGPFLTVSGKRASFGSSGRPEQRASGRALVLRRRELDHGFFSATWKLPAKGNLDSLYAESVDGVLRIYLRKRRAERRS